jgi:formylglycine-generating enzyme required for sulfatase activity
MAVIEGPVTFQMGSPPGEPESFDEERPQHPERINRRFAIATKEITREQYNRFLERNPKHTWARIDEYSPDPQGPQLRICWYDAAAYCNG